MEKYKALLDLNANDKGLSHIWAKLSRWPSGDKYACQCRKGQRNRFNQFLGHKDPLEEELSHIFSHFSGKCTWSGMVSYFLDSSYGMQDLQAEAPYHLLHLKIEVEKNRFLASVEECRAELDRETKLVPQEGSEKIIKEHRVRPRSPSVPSSI